MYTPLLSIAKLNIDILFVRIICISNRKNNTFTINLMYYFFINHCYFEVDLFLIKYPMLYGRPVTIGFRLSAIVVFNSEFLLSTITYKVAIASQVISHLVKI